MVVFRVVRSVYLDFPKAIYVVMSYLCSYSQLLLVVLCTPEDRWPRFHPISDPSNLIHYIHNYTIICILHYITLHTIICRLPITYYNTNYTLHTKQDPVYLFSLVTVVVNNDNNNNNNNNIVTIINNSRNSNSLSISLSLSLSLSLCIYIYIFIYLFISYVYYIYSESGKCQRFPVQALKIHSYYQ